MANYAAWDAYDVDRAMLEVDQNEALLDFKPTSAATLTKRVTENLEVIFNATRKTADALRSKVNRTSFSESYAVSNITLLQGIKKSFFAILFG